ncbi:MAG: hypothetical protein FVQ77_10460 [Cytophagales bacterium]|nr:hypothetical protein [Cytophagales bacterium]
MKGWETYSLNDIITIRHGWAFKGEFFSEEPTNDILLTPGNFHISGGFKADKLKYYNGEFPNDYLLEDGDVIVTMTDLSKEGDTLGYSAKAPSSPTKRYLHNQRIGLVKLKNKDFDLDFIYWLLRTQTYQSYIAASASGATVRHTSPTKIGSYKFKAPSDKNIQRKIASILSAYDDLIENNLQWIKLLVELTQITYQEWFVKEKESLPKGWEIKKIGDLLAKVKSSKKINNSEFKNVGAIPIIDQSRDFIAGYTDDEDALIDYDLPIIVFGDHTRIFKFANFPFARGADGTQLIFSNNKKMPQHLFYHSLMNVDLSNYHYARHFKFLKNLEIILPDEITAKKFEDFAKPIFDLITNLRHQNRLLKEARDILLPRLMTGMIEI